MTFSDHHCMYIGCAMIVMSAASGHMRMSFIEGSQAIHKSFTL